MERSGHGLNNQDSRKVFRLPEVRIESMRDLYQLRSPYGEEFPGSQDLLFFPFPVLRMTVDTEAALEMWYTQIIAHAHC